LTKKVLQVEFDYDFQITAIVSSYRDYQLSWHLNEQLGVDLAKQEDHKVPDKKETSTTRFSWFEYEDVDNEIIYSLLSNHTLNQFLLPELKMMDYLLVIRENHWLVDQDRLLEKIRQVPKVQTVMAIDPKTLKNKQNLILE